MTDREKFTFESDPEIRVGISSCLLGEMVRFNGGHAHDSFLTTALGQYFNWIPVCPEVEVGMGTPRENVRLVDGEDGPRMIAPKSETDWTDRMQNFASERVQQLETDSLHGFILKKDSPSCGMERVRVYDKNDIPHKDGTGLFAAELMRHFSLLPVEEEGRLRDAHLRENFIERVFAYYRLQRFLADLPESADLVEFHTRHKLTLMSHHQQKYREIGRLVAQAGDVDFAKLLLDYSQQFMETLKVKATAKNHTNVLHHAMGYFKKELDASDKEELVEVIENYRTGLVPLVVPITLVKHHLRKHPVKWLSKQVYLNPYPHELKLRNSI